MLAADCNLLLLSLSVIIIVWLPALNLARERGARQRFDEMRPGARGSLNLDVRSGAMRWRQKILKIWLDASADMRPGDSVGLDPPMGEVGAKAGGLLLLASVRSASGEASG